MEIALQEVQNLIADIDTETNEQIIEQIKISQSISSPQRAPEK
ncbi:hypothetical protein ACWEX2_03495 [Staphylococcus xylosus]|nr:hypothetical protein [Staphylococcus xylosus]